MISPGEDPVNHRLGTCRLGTRQRTVPDWYLPDQYIDVAAVPDGDYVLETIADPDGLLLEADETNNCDSIVIRIAGTSTGTPSAVILGPGPRCSALGL